MCMRLVGAEVKSLASHERGLENEPYPLFSLSIFFFWGGGGGGFTSVQCLGNSFLR